MSPEQFSALARELFGFGWQSALARECEVAQSTVHRWGDGESTIPVEAITKLRELAAVKAAAIVRAVSGA